MDIRDLFVDKVGKMRLYPYAKDVFWRPDGNVLGMTVEIYDDEQTHEFTFAFTPSGKLKMFLDKITEEEDEQTIPEQGYEAE